MASGWRADRSAWIPVGVVIVVLVVVGALATQAGDRQPDDDPESDPTEDTDQFVIEGESGTLVFDRDGDEAALDFEGPEGSGQFRFDLEGDGVVAEGSDGAFELTGTEPPGWPDDFPLPDDAVVVRGSVLGADGLSQLSATYAVPGAPEDVVAHFEAALAEDDPILDQEAGSPVVTVGFEGRWLGFLTIGPGDTGATLSVQLYVEADSDPTAG